MNGKKAKLLRKLVSYVKAEQPAEYQEQFRKTVEYQVGLDTKGLPVFSKVDKYQTKLQEYSSRTRYQTLKKAVKNGSFRVVRQMV